MDHLKHQAKLVLSGLARYILREKPIIISSTRRSGSTLLLQMLYSQPHVGFVYEPLALWRYHPHRDQLPNPPSDIFITLDPKAEVLLKSYLSELLSGRVRFQPQWNVAHPHFSFRVHRLAMKDVNANPLLPWFAANFDAHIIYLIRHPIATSLSIMRKGWPDLANIFMSDAKFLEKYLNDDMVDISRKVIAHGSELERYVLEWCFHNLIPLRDVDTGHRQWLTVTYEELVTHPEELSAWLCQQLGLSDPERMSRVIYDPVKHSAERSKEQIRTSGPEAMVDSWKNDVDTQMLNRIQQVLETFQMFIYSSHHPYPAVDWCHVMGPEECQHSR